MRYLILTKRYYTNRDLVLDRFGRLFHLPLHLSAFGNPGLILALDYREHRSPMVVHNDNLAIRTVPLRRFNPPRTWRDIVASGRAHRPDVIIASGDTPLGLAGQRLAQLTGAAFVFDIYDDYRTFASARLPGMTNLFYRLSTEADLVVFSSKRFQTDIQAKTRLRRTLVVENGYDPSVFRPRPRTEARRRFDLPQKGVVIGYFGSISYERGIDVLSAAAGRLKEHLDDITLVVAGRLTIPASDLDKPYIRYFGDVSQDTVAEMINACDVVTIPYRNTAYTQATQACKIAEYLASGVAVVATRVGENEAAFADTPQSLCRPDDVVDLSNAVAAQVTRPQLGQSVAALTWTALAGRLNSALQDLADGGAGCGTGIDPSRQDAS